MDVDFARRYPVATFASGPTNSMRGAALPVRPGHRARSSTSAARPPTSACSSHGFPREATTEVDVGRRPDQLPDARRALASASAAAAWSPTARPVRSARESVGYRLTEEALVFGGYDAHRDRHRGRRRPGRRSATPRWSPHLDPTLVKAALGADRRRHRRRGRPDAHLARAAAGRRRRRRVDPAAGRSARHLRRCTGPEHFAVANAIGAAIAQVGGEVDRVFAIDPGRRDAVARRGARRRRSTEAIAAGADPAHRADRRLRRGADPVSAGQRDPHPRARRSATSTWGA